MNKEIQQKIGEGKDIKKDKVSFEVLKKIDTSEEQDIILKIRMMRFLWYNNSIVAHNVKLYRYEQGIRRHDTYTDLDVMGISFNKLLEKDLKVCDCKSGRTTKTKERLFWISGVMQFIGAKKAYFVRDNMVENHYFDLSNKLNINLISNKQIEKLEELYSIDQQKFIGPFNPSKIVTAESTMLFLKKYYFSDYIYLRDLFWSDTSSEQIKKVLRIISIILKIKEPYDNVRDFLFLYSLSLLSIPLLDLTNKLLYVQPENQEEFIKNIIINENPYSRTKLVMYEKFYEFMTAEIKQRFNKKYPVSKEEFMSLYEPGYMKYLIDLIQRIHNYCKYASPLPQILQLAAYESVEKLTKISWDDIPSIKDLEKSKKIVEDLLTFFKRIEYLDNNNFEKYFNIFK